MIFLKNDFAARYQNKSCLPLRFPQIPAIVELPKTNICNYLVWQADF